MKAKSTYFCLETFTPYIIDICDRAKMKYKKVGEVYRMMVHTCVTMRRLSDQNTITILLLENGVDEKNKRTYGYF